MNFIIDFPLTKGNDSIFVVINPLTKMAHFIPCNKIIMGEETTKLILDNIYHIYGLPNDIVLDRGLNLFPIFGEDFINLSRTYHPQTNGQTKKVNQIL